MNGADAAGMCSEWFLNVEDQAAGTMWVRDNFTFWKILSGAPFYILLLRTKHLSTLTSFHFPFAFVLDCTNGCVS